MSVALMRDTENREVSTLAIACMDWRLNGVMDKRNDGATAFLRGAGSSQDLLGSLKKITREHPELKHIEVITHSDCGAAGVIYKAKYDYENYAAIGMSQSVWRRIVDKFDEKKFKDKEEVALENGTALEKRIVHNVWRWSDADVAMKHVDLSRVEVPQDGGKHTLVLMKPSTQKYSETIEAWGLEETGAYVVQAENLLDMLPDIELASRALHIDKVFAEAGHNGFRQKELASIRRRLGVSATCLV